MSGETRMLERRVSNNRADLNNDQQMNYFLAWFQSWSDLQKADFIPVLASKIAGNVEVEVNGLCINDNKKKPLTLFQCQLKLFKDWVSIWNAQQQEYLLLRLKDLDANFYTKYEEFLENGENKPKDFFDPGVPAELVRASRKSSSTSSSPNVSLNGKESESEENEDPDKDIIEDYQPLSTIQEDE
eukprot:02617.XXX_74921_74194_1 [CDS] Oithona nana genome sequencing.